MSERNPPMSDHEVEMRLGCTPCVCGEKPGWLEGWHRECYRGKTAVEVEAGYKRAFLRAKVHLRSLDAIRAHNVIQKAARPIAP